MLRATLITILIASLSGCAVTATVPAGEPVYGLPRRRGIPGLRLGLVALAALRGRAPVRSRAARPRDDPRPPLLPVLRAFPTLHPKRPRQTPGLVQARAQPL